MKFFTELRIKIRNFIKRHKNKILLVFIAWVIILVINYFIGIWMQENEKITTYEPHTPIIETGETVSNKNQEKIEQVISEYIGYCNEKQYEKAYEMIKKECRDLVYPTLEDFKEYVDYVFSTYRIYNIQNYSNRNGKYFYRVRILEDILATGLSDTDNVQYFEDKFVLEEKNGQILLSVKEYIDNEELEKVYEDKYMKIVITNKITMFEEEIYTLQITNRTENILVIADDTYEPEITLSVPNTEIGQTEEGEYVIVLQPNIQRTYEISFANFFDEGKKSEKINLKRVRVFKTYTEGDKTENEKEENVVEVYNASINV